MRGSVVFAILATILVFALPGGASPASTIEVDTAQEVGPLPFLFRSGMFAYGSDSEHVYPNFLQNKFLKEHKPGAIEVGSLPFLYGSQSYDDFRNRLKNSHPDHNTFLRRIEENGGKVIISIFGMPRWLSSKPEDSRPVEPGEWMAIWGASPPKDYDKWAEVVQAIVEYYSNNIGLNAWYKVWWEPQGSRWQGTEEELFKLYKYTILGARRANKNAKVGGPSTVGWREPFWKNRDKESKGSMFYNFIKYCANTPVAQLGLDRVPIDFLIWHGMHLEPSDGFRRAMTDIREWLKQFGYPETTPTLIGEWTTWKDYKYPNTLSPERDTEYTAAYVIVALVGMDNAGITDHSFSALVEEQPARFTGEFGGDFGIFSKSLIIKPVYNAFRTLSYLGEKKLKAEVNDPFLAAVSTRSKESVALLIANFVPDGGMLRQTVVRMLYEKGSPYGLTGERLKQLFKESQQKGRVEVEGLRLPERVKQEVTSYFQLASTRAKEAVAVDLLFKNLPPDLVHYERYLIDATHSNSYAVRSRIEAALAPAKQEAREKAEQFRRQGGRSPQEINQLIRSQMTTVIEQINEWPEVRLREVEEKTIRSAGEYRETLHVSPYSVTLIRLSR